MVENPGGGRRMGFKTVCVQFVDVFIVVTRISSLTQEGYQTQDVRV